MNKKKSKVFILCTGLGRINRGYESFTRECFDELKGTDLFEIYLLKGGGVNKSNEIVIWNIPRHSKLALRLSKLLKTQAYVVEQFTFFLRLFVELIFKKPKVIYYSDFILGTYLWHLRRVLKFKYKLLFVNGASYGPPFKTEDHVQQLLPIYLETAIKGGESERKHSLLPYGFNIKLNERLLAIKDRNKIRRKMGFTENQIIILSVGAVNKYQKRMDYVVNEISNLSSNHFLIILGQFDDDTQSIIDLAEQKISGRYIISSVEYNQLSEYYIAADYFVLASLLEGFGRVFIEATSYGLPCIVHDYLNVRQVLKENGKYIDMNKKNALMDYLKDEKLNFSAEELIKFSYNNYSWEILRIRYLNMINNFILSN